MEKNAVAFEKGNVSDLKGKLEMLLADKETVDGYKKKSQEFICTKYNWNDVLEQTLALYKKME